MYCLWVYSLCRCVSLRINKRQCGNAHALQGFNTRFAIVIVTGQSSHSVVVVVVVGVTAVYSSPVIHLSTQQSIYLSPWLLPIITIITRVCISAQQENQNQET